MSVNLFVVNKAWLFSLLWCAGVDSVTTNDCQLLQQMRYPVWLIVRALTLLFLLVFPRPRLSLTWPSLRYIPTLWGSEQQQGPFLPTAPTNLPNDVARYQLYLHPVASVDLSPPRVSASCLGFLDLDSPPGPGDGANLDSDVLPGLWGLVWRVRSRCLDPSPDAESACPWEKQFGESRVKRPCLKLAELTTGSFSPCRTCKKERERNGKAVLRSRHFPQPLAFAVLTPFLPLPLPRLRDGRAAHQD